MNKRIVPIDVEPTWMTESVLHQVVRAASLALPNEFCGLITESDSGESFVHVFSGSASPTNFIADARELIALSYEIHDQNREVRATVHSHPLGKRLFSEADQMLAMWAPLHLLLFRDNSEWNVVWGRTVNL